MHTYTMHIYVYIYKYIYFITTNIHHMNITFKHAVYTYTTTTTTILYIITTTTTTTTLLLPVHRNTYQTLTAAGLLHKCDPEYECALPPCSAATASSPSWRSPSPAWSPCP